MARMTSIQFRWILLGAFFVLGLIGLFSSYIPYRVETLQICSVTGTVQREVAWMGLRRQTVLESTAWEKWVREREPEFEYQFVPWCSYRTFLASVRRSCFRSPAVAQLQDLSQTQLAAVSPDRLQGLRQLFSGDNDKAQRDAVAALVKEVR